MFSLHFFEGMFLILALLWTAWLYAGSEAVAVVTENKTFLQPHMFTSACYVTVLRKVNAACKSVWRCQEALTIFNRIMWCQREVEDIPDITMSCLRDVMFGDKNIILLKAGSDGHRWQMCFTCVCGRESTVHVYIQTNHCQWRVSGWTCVCGKRRQAAAVWLVAAHTHSVCRRWDVCWGIKGKEGGYKREEKHGQRNCSLYYWELSRWIQQLKQQPVK